MRSTGNDRDPGTQPVLQRKLGPRKTTPATTKEGEDETYQNTDKKFDHAAQPPAGTITLSDVSARMLGNYFRESPSIRGRPRLRLFQSFEPEAAPGSAVGSDGADAIGESGTGALNALVSAAEASKKSKALAWVTTSRRIACISCRAALLSAAEAFTLSRVRIAFIVNAWSHRWGSRAAWYCSTSRAMTARPLRSLAVPLVSIASISLLEHESLRTPLLRLTAAKSRDPRASGSDPAARA